MKVKLIYQKNIFYFRKIRMESFIAPYLAHKIAYSQIKNKVKYIYSHSEYPSEPECFQPSFKKITQKIRNSLIIQSQKGDKGIEN